MPAIYITLKMMELFKLCKHLKSPMQCGLQKGVPKSAAHNQKRFGSKVLGDLRKISGRKARTSRKQIYSLSGCATSVFRRV